MPDPRPRNTSVKRYPNTPLPATPPRPVMQEQYTQERPISSSALWVWSSVGIVSVLVLALVIWGVASSSSRTQTDYSATSTSTSASSTAPITLPCNRPVAALVWSPNQSYLATVCSYGRNPVSAIVDVWNVETKQKLFTLPGDTIVSVAWSPDGTKLVASYYGSRVTVCSLTGQTLLTVQGLDIISISNVSWSPDGQYIFVGGNYPVIIDSTTGNTVQRVWQTNGWSGGSNFVWLSNDTIVGLDGSGATKIVEWNRQTEQYTTLYRENYYPYDFIMAFALSPDGKKIVLGLEASGSGVPSLRIIDSASGAVLTDQKTTKNDVRAVAWSPDDRFIAYSSYSLGTITISDSQTGQQVSTKDVDEYDGNTIVAISWSPNSQALAIGTGNKTQIISVV